MSLFSNIVLKDRGMVKDSDYKDGFAEVDSAQIS